METSNNPFKRGLYGLTKTEIIELASEAVEVAHRDDLPLDKLDEDAVHINARVSPSSGGKYLVCLVGVYRESESLTSLGGITMVIEEKDLARVYTKQYLTWEEWNSLR